MPSETSQLSSPGFVTVIFDIPFPISVPNGHYLTHDPHKNIACISTILREGSRAFFRSRPVTGPTSFRELTNRAQELDRPRADHSYLLTSQLKDGSQKATLNIHAGADGGYAECKYFSEVHVTFLADSLTIINEESRSLNRACEILNPFLDKYRLFTEDYRVGRVSLERNFYFATCHTSALTADEVNMTSSELFNRLFQMERTFSTTLGHGRANILRTNTLELLGPKGEMSGQSLTLFGQLLLERYEMPLSYELILESLSSLQKAREYRLAIVHAETAFEVYVADFLLKLMVDRGMSQSQAVSEIETNQDYWGIKKRLRRLDAMTQNYASKNSLPFIPFVNSPLYISWDSDLYQKRNAAVHAGANNFAYHEAWKALGIAKECIVHLEARIPGLANYVQMNPSMAGYRQNAGEVMF